MNKMGIEMGIGKITDGNHIPRRKLYWTTAFYSKSGQLLIPEDVVRISARPSFTIEETTIDYINYIPGKTTWEELTITREVDDNNDAFCLFSRFINEQYAGEMTKFDAVLNLHYKSHPDEIGESWELKDCFITSVNIGELDFSNTAPPELEARIRYSSAKYTSPLMV